MRCFNFSKRCNWLVGLILYSLVSGCSSITTPKVETIHIDQFPPYEMPDGTKIYPASADETIPDADILSINNNIKNLLEEKVRSIKNLDERLRTVVSILVNRVKYDTVNDIYGVKTAQETFDAGTGNCLSFSNLFVAMARYVGFNSKFAEIPTVPNWTREGDMLFFTRHIGASADVSHSYDHIIELENPNDYSKFMSFTNINRYYFSPTELSSHEPRLNLFSYQTVSDKRAFAQFYNNLGSKCLAEGKAPDAFRYYIKAIKVDPQLSFAWSNLGVIYRQNRQYKTAEKSYLKGLQVTRGSKDISALTIMNNLQNLYEMTGEKDNSEFYKNQVASLREKNPYYKYVVGKTAYYDALYIKAIGLFKEAIRLKKDEHLFYYNLAITCIKTGDIKNAELNINNAIKYSFDEKEKRYYGMVLDEIKKMN